MKLKFVYKVLFLLLFGGIVVSCASKQVSTKKQSGLETSRPAGEEIRLAEAPDEVYMMTEVVPRFSKGKPQEWVARNVKYPLESMQKRQEGKVFIEFIIEKDGTVSEPKIIRSSGHYLLDAEGIRIISQMPAWSPGMQKGKKVRVSHTLPISFNLSR